MLVKDIGYVAFTGAAGGPTVGFAAGIAVARTGAGIYTLTLGVAVDANNASYSINAANGAFLCNASVIETSDTVKELRVFDNVGAASDTFSATVLVQSVAGGGVGGG